MQTSSGSVDKGDTKRDPSRLRDRPDERTIYLLQVKQERCELSFNQLYRYYAPRLCAFLRQKGASDRISQEVMQDVMARVWEKTHQYDAATANATAIKPPLSLNVMVWLPLSQKLAAHRPNKISSIRSSAMVQASQAEAAPSR